MKQQHIKQVVLMSHGWGYNHHFFDPFLNSVPVDTHDSTLFVCLDAGYFPDQSKAGLVVQTSGEWVHHPLESLHSLVLAHAEVPWLGMGHSLGFSKLLDFSVRWHSLISLHGFTRFTKNDIHPAGTAPRVLSRMIEKAGHNIAEVLGEFHARCGHQPRWTVLDEHALLNDLQSMVNLDCAATLSQALSHGADFNAWAGTDDQIVPLALAQTCFADVLSSQGRALFTPAAQHADFASAPARYTDTLLPLLSQR